MFNVLVCEDEKNIRNLVCEYLKRDGYNIFEAENGEIALDIIDTTHIDLLITDIMMPKMDGCTLTNDLRCSGYNLPILMITAKETLNDKKKGFLSGTDDYMVKPIDMDEMLLRVSALFRRAKITSEKKIIIGNTELNFDKLTVITNIKDLTLPKKEFQLLFMLLSQIGRIFTRAQIMDEIWGYNTESDEQTINVHIRKLREKFENNSDFEILTVKGLGYKAVKK